MLVSALLALVLPLSHASPTWAEGVPQPLTHEEQLGQLTPDEWEAEFNQALAECTEEWLVPMCLEAKENRDPNVIYMLGDRYFSLAKANALRNPDGLIQPYYEKAMQWSRLSADKDDHPLAKYNLSWMYAHGLGVDRDYLVAYVLISEVVASGFDSEFTLGLKHMTHSQLNPGQASEADWWLSRRSDT